MNDDFPPRDSRSLEERRLDVLRDWLQRENWAPDEAEMILVGMCPHLSYSVEEGHWWLPGTASDVNEEEVQDRLWRVRTVVGVGGGKPCTVLTRALGKDWSPPWLPAALADAGCREFLPDSLISQSDRGEKVTSPLSEANRKKRRDQLATDDMQKLLADAGRDCFNELAASGFVDLRTADGEPVVAQIARAIRAAMVKANDGDEKGVIPVPRTVENHVKVWLEELDSERAGAGSEPAPADV